MTTHSKAPDFSRQSSRQDTAFDAAALRSDNVLGKKITEARKKKKLSQKTLAERFRAYNLPVRAGAISKWETGDALPNPFQLFALCRILEIRDVLSYFTGQPSLPEAFSPALNPEGRHILQLFQETLLASGCYPAEAPLTERFSAPRTPVSVRVFSTPAAAGSGSFLDGEDYDMIEFDPANIPEGTDFGIRVTGDSMLPRYVPGQIVFVRQCPELRPGEIGVFVCDGSAYIKQYTEASPTADMLEAYMASDGTVRPRITLLSLNRDRADCDVAVGPENALMIIGRVLN